MDPITQGFLGAAAAQSIAGKQLGRLAVLIGILAGFIADFNLLLQPHTTSLQQVFMYRHMTHAFLLIIIFGAMFGGFCCLCFKNVRPHWRLTLIAAIAAYGIHALVDCFGSYGTELLWPFSAHRFAFDYISSVDPFLTIILLVGVLTAFIKTSSRAAQITLLICCCYLGFTAIQHYRAASAQAKLATLRGQTITRGRVLPRFGDVFAWHSVYISNDKIYLDTVKTPLLTRSQTLRGASFKHFMASELPTKLATQPDLNTRFKTFYRFADGYVVQTSAQPLTLADCRYVHGDHAFISRWGVTFIHNSASHANKQYELRWLRNVSLPDDTQ